MQHLSLPSPHRRPLSITHFETSQHDKMLEVILNCVIKLSKFPFLSFDHGSGLTRADTCMNIQEFFIVLKCGNII